jgi:Ca2+-binding EF-hand superfamily protein
MKRIAILTIALGACAGAAWAQDDMLAADSNGDGQITRAEAQAARAAMFDRLDANSDGFISAEERAAASAASARRRGMQRVDANNDGQISRAEFTGSPMRLFDHFDADNNDVLSASEVEALRAAGQRRRR